ncbi:hypothetical protein NMG60_11024945 [Bertholletia excelsa]
MPMARKGNHQRNGYDRNLSNQKKGVSDSMGPMPNKRGRGKMNQGKVTDGEELPNGNQPSIPISESLNKNEHSGDDGKRKHKSNKPLKKETQDVASMQGVKQTVLHDSNSGDCIENVTTNEANALNEENGRSPNGNHILEHSNCGSGSSSHSPRGLGMDNVMDNSGFLDNLIFKHVRDSALSIWKAASDCFKRKKPLLIILTTNMSNVAHYFWDKIVLAYPVVWRWLIYFGNIMLILSLVWLDCTIRGIDSFFRMGTTSFFSVIWCSTLSVIAMIGIFKFFMVLVVTALMGFLVGFTIAILLTAVSGIVFLWFYGSFWTTTFIICSGGLAFMLSHERLALLITTTYSLFCALTYVGWLGLLLALSLSFISSDVLIFFLKNNMNEHRRPAQAPEQTARMEGQSGFFYGEPGPSSPETGSGLAADRGPGMPSTSGNDSEITSEDEVVRLLNCADHYSALGFPCYENVDVSILKREYRKKAMLVHPDKNMGNEKAAEAFKKLQNAYEVLLDSSKRKEYDDELRREELLKYFRRFQSASQKNGRHKFFGSGFPHSGADGEDLLGESRRITCRKCGNFHLWIHTKKSKSKARWCQDCKDFHQVKDGDGWVEQSSQPFFFGLLQKVDAPRAYICADSKIYDATEWYICQGMRCPVNSHKPSFHVNTSLNSKHNGGKGNSSGQRGGSIPASNPEESMTEEEFLEWLQNAVQAGMFNNFTGSPSSESSATKTGNSSKSNSTYSGSSSSNSKRKKKGKKQW